MPDFAFRPMAADKKKAKSFPDRPKQKKKPVNSNPTR